MTIFGKSICKKYAIDNSTSIIIKVGKVISWFTPQNKDKNKKQNKKDKSENEEIALQNDDTTKENGEGNN